MTIANAIRSSHMKRRPTHDDLLCWFIHSELDLCSGTPEPPDIMGMFEKFRSYGSAHWHRVFWDAYDEFQETFLPPEGEEDREEESPRRWTGDVIGRRVVIREGAHAGATGVIAFSQVRGDVRYYAVELDDDGPVAIVLNGQYDFI